MISDWSATWRCLASSSSWSVGLRGGWLGVTGVCIILEFLCPWLGGVPGLLFPSLPLSDSLLRLSAWLGGGGRGLWGGGPGGVPTLGRGGRDGGPGSGISSFLELLRCCSCLDLLPGEKFFSAMAWAALVLSCIAWKFFLRVFSPGAWHMKRIIYSSLDWFPQSPVVWKKVPQLCCPPQEEHHRHSRWTGTPAPLFPWQPCASSPCPGGPSAGFSPTTTHVIIL